jgi:hypothetical protein
MTVLNSASNPKQREWSYDVMTDCYRHISGVIVDRMDIDNCGGDLEAALNNALKMSQMSNMASVGAIGAPLQYPNSMYNGIGQMPTNPMIQSGTFTINNPPNPNNFIITTDKGVVTLNLKTGDITFPLEIGRDEAIRDFWMGFQKYFTPSDVDEVAKLKTKLKETEQAAEEYKKYVHEKTIKGVVDKITKKYSNEKFIMTKPADLIKLIEEA